MDDENISPMTDTKDRLTMTEQIINQPSFINYTSYFWIISISPFLNEWW